jgi:hypothetical protein
LNSLVPRQRYVSEVRYPSQKVIMECDAFKNPRDPDEFVPFVSSVPQGHGKGRFMTLRIDGHASVTWYPVQVTGGTPHRYDVWQLDPSGPQGWGIGSLAWMDVP